MAAAFLLHAAAVALLLVKLPAEPLPEIPSIPVEIVPEAAPKPEVEAKAEPQPQPQPESQPQPDRPRVSGGEATRAPGKTAEAPPPPKDSPAPAPKPARPSPKRLLSPLSLPLPAEPSAMSIPFDPPPPPEVDQAMIPAAPPPVPPAPPDTSLLPGEGGGDPYLNAVRDAILSRFAYPPEAVSVQLAGTARYEITLDRDGNVIGLRLLQSAGSNVLDQAGMDTIKRAAPFGPPPADIGGERVGLIFTLSMVPPSASSE
jgi:protein TonB